MINILYGDGIHDDTAAIQEMIAEGGCELSLPMPEKFYLISKPIEIPSGFKLTLPRAAEVRLAKGSNCVMLKNKLETPEDAEYTGSYKTYVNAYADASTAQNIEICGGIWNANNMEQAENPLISHTSIPGFWGFCFSFYKTVNLKISQLTIKDPTAHGINLDAVTYFTVEDITFDFNPGNPKPTCMNGLNLMGNCLFGTICNLTGACCENTVSLNSEEGSHGDISYITIDGVSCGIAPAGIRMFIGSNNIENIRISNVSGTFSQTCFAFIKVGGNGGIFDTITIENVHADLTKAIPERTVHPDFPEGPLVYIDYFLTLKNLTISDFYHDEKVIPRETFLIGENVNIDRLIMKNVRTTNTTSGKCPLFLNYGKIGYISYRGVDTGKDDKYPLRISFDKIMEF